MAVSIKEREKFRSFTGKGTSRRYWLTGSSITDEVSAQSAVIAAFTAGTLPATIGGFPPSLPDIQYDEVETNRYEAVISWKDPSFGGGGGQQAGNFSISFDISGQNSKITHALNWNTTGSTYTASGKAPRLYKGAINVKQDGTVEGTDILVPFATLCKNITITPAQMTQAYYNQLCRTVGKVCSGTYLGFDAGELLLTKASGQQRDSANWDISLGFAISENATGIQIGDITGISKKGWYYMWVYYEPDHDATNGVQVSIPTNVYVAQVYKEVSYSGLIPT